MHKRGSDDRHIITSENEGDNTFEFIFKWTSIILAIITFPLSAFICLVPITEYERAVVFRLGRLKKGGARGPGLIIILPCIDEFVKIDLRTDSFDVAPQEILTMDAVTILVDAVVYFHVRDPLKAVIQIANYRTGTQLFAQTTLRNVAATKNLMDLLTQRNEVSQAIGAALDEGTKPWGVQVERVELKEVELPHDLQRAMAAEAEAVRLAKAKVVAAEGEMNAAKALKQASDVMQQNPITLQLRYLQTLSAIAHERKSTVLFPFPIELFQKLADVGGVKGGAAPLVQPAPLVQAAPLVQSTPIVQQAPLEPTEPSVPSASLEPLEFD